MIKLYHISEQRDIREFKPRPSPSEFAEISGDVVFAISERLLHNYLLPRDCPRVTYYTGPQTSATDKANFFGQSTAEFIVAVPSEWYEVIKTTVLYRYEFAPDNFTLLDGCAGYYISFMAEKPISVMMIPDMIGNILSANTELRFVPSILPLSKAVKASSLCFSMIRMRNARA